MSIIAYVGLPGSGKTYDTVANQILPALAQDRRVVTNIPLNRDEIRKHYLKGEIVDFPLDVIMQQPEKIEEYAPAGCLLVIDEAWRLWPCGLKADKVPQAFKSLLAEHRHKLDAKGRAMQIVLVTQDLAQLAAFGRQLVEQTFHHTKLTTVGLRGSYRIDIFHGAITGAVPPVNNRIREIVGKYSPRVYKFYKSHTMSDAHGDKVDERPMDKRGNFWRKPVVYVGLAFVGVAIWGGSSMLIGLFQSYTGTAEASVASSGGPVEAAASPKPSGLVERVRPAAAAAKAPAVPPYRLLGYVQVGDSEAGSALITDGKASIFLPWSQCRYAQEGDVRCRYDGHWIGEFGVMD